MPLRVTKRPETGSLWIVGTVTPAGEARGVRVRRRAGSDDERLAREEAAAIEANILRSAWHGERRAPVAFSQAVFSYLSHEPRSTATKALVRRLLLHWRETPLAVIDQAAVDAARAVVLRPGAAPGTVRRNLIVPLRAILLHAQKRGWCDAPAFDLPAEPRGRTAILLPHQVEALLAGASEQLRPLLRFLICTGCRMGEALSLRWDQVDLQGARAILWEGETKGDTRRVVILPPAAIATLARLPGRDGAVFRSRLHDGAGEHKPYRATEAGGGGQIRKPWGAACAAAGLPGEWQEWKRKDRPGQVWRVFVPEHTPHVLRHTWASYHYALHRDLLRLRHEGGWSDTKLVERYAHIMPGGHEDAIRRLWGETPSIAAVARR